MPCAVSQSLARTWSSEQAANPPLMKDKSPVLSALLPGPRSLLAPEENSSQSLLNSICCCSQWCLHLMGLRDHREQLSGKTQRLKVWKHSKNSHLWCSRFAHLLVHSLIFTSFILFYIPIYWFINYQFAV